MTSPHPLPDDTASPHLKPPSARTALATRRSVSRKRLPTKEAAPSAWQSPASWQCEAAPSPPVQAASCDLETRRTSQEGASQSFRDTAPSGQKAPSFAAIKSLFQPSSSSQLSTPLAPPSQQAKATALDPSATSGSSATAPSTEPRSGRPSQDDLPPPASSPPATLRKRALDKFASLTPKLSTRRERDDANALSLGHLPALDMSAASTGAGPLLEAAPPTSTSVEEPSSATRRTRWSPSLNKPGLKRIESDSLAKLRSKASQPRSAARSTSLDEAQSPTGQPVPLNHPHPLHSPFSAIRRRFAQSGFEREPVEFPFPLQDIEDSPFLSSSASTDSPSPAPFVHDPTPATRPKALQQTPFAIDEPQHLTPRPSYFSDRKRSSSRVRQHRSRPQLQSRRSYSSGVSDSPAHDSGSSGSRNASRSRSFQHPPHPYLHRPIQPAHSFSTLSTMVSDSRDRSPSPWPPPHLTSRFSDWTPTPPDSSRASLASSPSFSPLAAQGYTSQHPSGGHGRFRPLLSRDDRREVLLRKKRSAPGLLDFASLEMRTPTMSTLLTPVGPARDGTTGEPHFSWLDEKDVSSPTTFRRQEGMTPANAKSKSRKSRTSMESVGVQTGEMISTGTQSSPLLGAKEAAKQSDSGHGDGDVPPLDAEEGAGTWVGLPRIVEPSPQLSSHDSSSSAGVFPTGPSAFLPTKRPSSADINVSTPFDLQDPDGRIVDGAQSDPNVVFHLVGKVNGASPDGISADELSVRDFRSTLTSTPASSALGVRLRSGSGIVGEGEKGNRDGDEAVGR